MVYHNRRTFLSSSALAAFAVGGWHSQMTAEEAKPDDELALINGNIYTVDEKRPKAEAFLVRQGRLAAVGSTAEIKSLASKNVKIIDAEGGTVVPGFIDAHTHPADSGVSELLLVDCNRPTIAEIVAAVRERAAKTTGDEWIHGFKFDDTKLKDERLLTRADLDKATPKHPVQVTHRGGHTAIFNSVAFERAKVTKDTPDPMGGKFGRDEKGELTGFAAEKALEAMNKVSRPLSTVSARQRQAGVKLISEMMTRAGLTSVHDAQASKEDFIAYQDALAAGELAFRVYVLAQADFFASLRSAGMRPGFGNDRLRVGGLKLFCDGSASERTMRMSKPYVGRPSDYGILVTTQDQLNDAVAEAHAAGWQVGVHANGDVAIGMVLTAHELAARLHPRRDARPRIEHCTLVNGDLLKRIAALGAIPTPFYTYVYYHGDKWAQYGEERTRNMFAHRSFLDHGIRVAAASDYVPGPFEPLMAIQSMVTRKDYRGRVWGENQRISVGEALRICTINGAYASFEEGVKGSITPGKLADFVMLASDPHKAEPDKIKDIQVLRTVVGGKTVFAGG